MESVGWGGVRLVQWMAAMALWLAIVLLPGVILVALLLAAHDWLVWGRRHVKEEDASRPWRSARSPPLVPILAKALVGRFTMRSMLAFVGVMALLFAVVARSCGPVSSKSHWPPPLVELAAAASEKGVDLGDIRVHCEWTLGGVDGTWFWEMKSSPGVLRLIKRQWMLTPLDKKSSRVAAFLNGMPSDWLSKIRTADADYFIADRYMTQGTRYIVMHDTARERVVVRYDFDF